GLSFPYPLGFDYQFTLVLLYVGRNDLFMVDLSIFIFSVGRDGVGIVPVVDAIYIPVIKPQSDMMRMVCSFSGHFFQRILTRNFVAIGGDQRPQYRFHNIVWINIGRKQ